MTDHDAEADTTDLESVFAEVDELLFDEEFDEAADAVERAIDDHGDIDDLLVLRAEVALEADRFEACVEAADEALQVVDDDRTRGELLELKGYGLFYLDDLEEARQTFNTSIRVGEASWMALLGRAMVHEEMMYDRAAMLDLDRVVAIDDQEAQPFAIRGNIHLRRGDLEEAEGDLDHAVRMDPYDDESRLDLARIQATGGRTSEAIETLEPLVEEGEDPDLVMPAALLRSQLSLGLGSSGAATEDAETAVEAAPDEPWGYLQLAACRISAMNPGDAIAAIKEAESTVEELSEIPDAYALRASAYEKLDKPEKAARMREKAEGSARLPGIVYGQWLNPAENIPLNPNKPIDARTVMEQMFDDPSRAPDGYREQLQEVIDEIPERIEQNPEAEQLRIELPEVEGAEDAPRSLVIQVNQGARGQSAGDES